MKIISYAVHNQSGKINPKRVFENRFSVNKLSRLQTTPLAAETMLVGLPGLLGDVATFPRPRRTI